MSQSKILAYADPVRGTSEPPIIAPKAQHFTIVTPAIQAPLLEAPTLTTASLTAWTMPRLWIL